MFQLVGFLLAAGSITARAHVHQGYVLISTRMKWSEARTYCRETHTDLITIESLEDMKVLSSIADSSILKVMFWTGLMKYEVKSWMWSSGDTPGLGDYTNWARSPNSPQDCGAMRDDGKWLSALCSATLPFVCQTDDGSYDVIHTKLTWRQAQKYCRKNGNALARARSRPENKAVQEVLNGSASSFWMGLFRDGWKWSDQSNSSFRSWQSTQPNNDGSCMLYDALTNSWWDRNCEHEFSFFCYNAITVARRVVVEMRSESSFNFNDLKVSDALLTQIQNKFTGVKLQWGVQPDGKIFHKLHKINEQDQKANATTSACS